MKIDGRILESRFFCSRFVVKCFATMAVILVGCVILAAPSFAFKEDFGQGSDRRSIAHDDLVAALARCAGYSAQDAQFIAEADQATDLGHFGSAHFSFTSRSGVNALFFHFPSSAIALPSLEGWAAGIGPLTDEVGNLVSGCHPTGECCDRDGISHCVSAGSLESMGIWLHSLADSYSHKGCTDSGGINHRLYDPTDPDQEAYCGKGAHAREWLTSETTLNQNALAGLLAVRDAIESTRIASGLAVCFSVSNPVLTHFSRRAKPSERLSVASNLFAACDAICP